MRLLKFILPVGAILLSSACAEKYAEKADEVVDVPDSFASTPVDAQKGQTWCTDFGDPQLASLVDQAYGENFTMLAGWARLRQAEAAADSADATLFPTIDAELSAGRERRPAFGTPIGGGPPVPEANEENQFRASSGVAYEIDLWGKLSATRKAAEFEYEATRADAESLAISISSNVAEAYFDVVAENEQIALIKEQLETSERFLQLTMLRLEQGSATALEVQQQRQQVESLNGQLAVSFARRDAAAYQLAALVGENPSSFEAPAAEELPDAPIVTAGIPADLLEQRPDLRAARLRLEAADERSVATARDRLPSLRLSASVFLQAAEIGNLFDDVFYSLLGAASAPLLDGGRRRADTRAAEARAEAALYDYAGTLLTALSEVGSALVLQERQQEFVESLEKQNEAAESVLELARDRYRVGATSYLQVLTALQSYQSAQQSLISARRQQLSYGLQLCRAAGGDWTQELEPQRHAGVKE